MTDDNCKTIDTERKHMKGTSVFTDDDKSFAENMSKDVEQRPVSNTMRKLSEMSIECSTAADQSQSLSSLQHEHANNSLIENRSVIEQKVKSVFELPLTEHLINEFPCYLIKWVTLPGWMYLTNNFICFYATLPNKKNDPFITGYLSKRNHVTSPRTHRYYFELKNHTLFWASSADTKYLPIGSIDVKDIIKIEASNVKKFAFKLITNKHHSHTFIADSEVSRREWMDELKKSVFMTQHIGNRVRIILPLAEINRIDKPPVFQFSASIRFRFFEEREDESEDYYFAFFPEIDEAYKQIVEVWTSLTRGERALIGSPKDDHSQQPRSVSASATSTAFPSFENLIENISPAALPAMLMGKLMNVTTSFQQGTGTDDDSSQIPEPAEEHPSLEIINSPAATKHYRSRHKSLELGRVLLGSATSSSNESLASTITSKLKRNTLFTTGKSATTEKENGNAPVPNTISSDTHATTIATPSLSDKKDAGSNIHSLHRIHRAVTDAFKHPLASWKDKSSSKSNAEFAETTTEPSIDSTEAAPYSSIRNSNDDAISNRSMSVALTTDSVAKTAQKSRRSRSKSFGSALISGTWNKLASGSTDLLPALSTRTQQQQQHSDQTAGHKARPKGPLWLSQPTLEALANMTKIINDNTSNEASTSDETDSSLEEDRAQLEEVSNFAIETQLAKVAAADPQQKADEQQVMNERLKAAFPMLLEFGKGVEAAFKCSFWKTIPYAGRVFITDNYLCFHSKILAGTQKLIVPWLDVIQLNKLNSRSYYSTFELSVIVKDMTEEIIFDFRTAKLRDVCYAVCQLKTSDAAIFDECSVISEESNTVSMRSVLLDRPKHVIPPKEYNGPPLLSSSSYLNKSSTKQKHPEGSLHITCLTIGSRGDVQPYIALCKELQKDGHRCRIATHPEYEKWIRQHDIEFKSLGGDPGELMRLCIDNSFLSVSFIREGTRFFYSWFKSLLEAAYEACRGTDILIESPSAMVGVHMAEKLQIAYFRSMPFPYSRTTKFPHPFAIQPSSVVAGGRIYNDMTYMMIDMALWAGTARHVNRFRREVLHIPPTTLDGLELWKVPYIYSFSPTVVHPPKDWPDYIHCTGYWFLDNPDTTWKPDHSLLEFLNRTNDSRPIIYIGFGSIIVPNAVETTHIIIDSVLDAGVRAIICKGWSARKAASASATTATSAAKIFKKTHRKAKSLNTAIEYADDKFVQQQQQQQQEERELQNQDQVSDRLLDGYPGTVYQLDSVPHDWLFPKIQGVVHHGGAGTTAAGLRAGLPTVIKPFFGDQRFWGQRIEELQIGVCLSKLSKAQLTDALKEITSNQTMITKAQSIGETLRKENGPRNAVECIYREYEFAKQQRTRFDNL